jgi:hypothetical protein
VIDAWRYVVPLPHGRKNSPASRTLKNQKEPQATSHVPFTPTMLTFLGMRKRFQKRERTTLHSRAPGLTPPLTLDKLLSEPPFSQISASVALVFADSPCCRPPFRRRRFRRKSLVLRQTSADLALAAVPFALLSPVFHRHAPSSTRCCVWPEEIGGARPWHLGTRRIRLLALHFSEIGGSVVVAGTCAWGRVDDGLGRKAGGGLRVDGEERTGISAGERIGADGEEQGI